MYAGGRIPLLHAALDAARARPAFARTTAPAAYYVEAYRSYAARSAAA